MAAEGRSFWCSSNYLWDKSSLTVEFCAWSHLNWDPRPRILRWEGCLFGSLLPSFRRRWKKIGVLPRNLSMRTREVSYLIRRFSFINHPWILMETHAHTNIYTHTSSRIASHFLGPKVGSSFTLVFFLQVRLSVCLSLNLWCELVYRWVSWGSIELSIMAVDKDSKWCYFEYLMALNHYLATII